MKSNTQPKANDKANQSTRRSRIVWILAGLVLGGLFTEVSGAAYAAVVAPTLVVGGGPGGGGHGAQGAGRARSASTASNRSSRSLRATRSQPARRPRSVSLSSHVSQRVQAVTAPREGQGPDAGRTSSAARRLSTHSEKIQPAERRASVERLAHGSGGVRASVPSLRGLLGRAGSKAAQPHREAQTIEAATARHAASAAKASGPGFKPEYPANGGFAGRPQSVTLTRETIIDRFGSDGGRFASPVGTPFPARSLKPELENGPYARYQVVKPLPVHSGPAVPWFGQPGGGTQHFLGRPVRELVQDGYLKKLD
ncbi:MAG: TNT domain-containing protein [Planctomycetes bacterium]|nr:TNT domain-containing protein [Planctomycetota bacterium]MCB9911040.1 TNT domain-containing protein [Planctomycetota bacterium]MCB9911493.1 TNT domain-containing protein [Planctomycetota bacterium]HPF14986.1 TNT domain-containing protein [Planctomycetota bacterium]